MSHLSPETLGALHDGALEGGARREAERHLETCAECRERLAELAAQDERVARALDHDPGDAYFEKFADRVAQRIRASASAPARAAGAGGWRWLLAPRRVAWLASAAAVVVVSVLVYVQSQETRVPVASPELAAREQRRAVPEARVPQPSAATETESRDEAGRLAQPPPQADEFRRANESQSIGQSRAGTPAPGDGAPSPPAAKKLETEPSAPSGAPRDQAARSEIRGAEGSLAKPQSAITGSPRDDRAARVEEREAAPAPPASSPQRADQKSALRIEVMDRALKSRAATPLQTAAETSATGARFGFAAEPGKAASALSRTVGKDGDVWTWPAELRPLAEIADSLTARARDTRSAVDHDVAAAAWSRVCILAAPRGAADREARARVADERYAAWSIEPTSGRLEAARTAVRAALDLAPAGARRLHFEELLDRLR